MSISREDVDRTVKRVLADFTAQHPPEATSPPPPASRPGADGLFATVDEAVAAAKAAQESLHDLSLSLRYDMINQMRVVMRRNAEALSWMAREETGLGRYEDKVEKNLLVTNKTPGPEDLEPRVQTGDHGLTLTELAPFGVVASITPTTNPTATVINNTIGIVSAGNAVAYNFHPGAKNCCGRTVQLLNEAVTAVGGPPNLVTCVATPTIETAQALMRHHDVRLLLVTGGPGVVKEAMSSGKRAVCAGPGNPPVVVDETADFEQAARDIIRGGSFDNQIVCVTEKEVLCVEAAAERLKRELFAQGAYELKGWELGKVEKVVFEELRGPSKPGVVRKSLIGKDAAVILAEAGIKIDAATRLVVADVPPEHPLVWTEQMMPIMPLARVRDVDTAIDLAKRVEHGFRHTAIMHSRNVDALSRMARVMDCSIFVKNGSSLAGLGAGGEGFTSMSIASPTGEGLTGPRTFVRQRRCVLVDRFRIV
jgi:acyl-CoA reductase-like NAD-dependent aldehyde dehydrogenase